MGGICAIIGEAGDPELPERLDRMLGRSPYRGSPARRIEGGIALGVQSLRGDASLGERGPYVVAFHGWIGNWEELAQASGIDLRGAANDAERLAGAFEALGTSAFARLRGEFATVVLGRRSGSVVAARDVVGMRPLFVHRQAGRTFVGAEIRQTLAGSGATAELDEVVLASFLTDRYGAGERTIFTGVERVVPGHAYAFDAARPNDAPAAAPYWMPPTEERRCAKSEGALAEELRFILDRAVGRTLAARAGAVALSGGMDSSTVWALARRRANAGDDSARNVGAISLAFPGFECDEACLVAEIVGATGGGLASVDAGAVPPFGAVERLTEFVEEPFFATLYHDQLIAEAARAHGREVVYFGFGGDEWMAGSAHYLGDELRRGHPIRTVAEGWALLHGTKREKLRKLGGFTVAPLGGFPWRRQRLMPGWLHPVRRAMLLPPLPVISSSRTGQVLWRTLARHRAACYMGNVELVSACQGIEIRCPLHDLDLIEFAFRTPGRAFMGGRREKHLLRVAMAGLLPASVVEREEKAEFSSPFRRGAVSFARLEDVPRWRLGARELVAAGQVEHMRQELAAGRGAEYLYDFLNLAIAERCCRHFDF